MDGRTHRRGTARLLAAVLVATLMATLASAGPAASPTPRHRAPEFAGVSRWLNSPPLSMRRLRGKVVLIDFWAYSCINCLHTLPHLERWYDTYRDQGLVIVGVHTPEFAFERDPVNLARAVAELRITYPVAMDNDRGTWNAWRNEYWPTEYLINRAGEVIATHIGEGDDAVMENAIRAQLGIAPLTAAPPLDARPVRRPDR